MDNRQVRWGLLSTARINERLIPVIRASLAPYLLLCLCAITSFAQYNSYRFDHWTTDNGLPQNTVRHVLQTRDGYLWLTTFDGLTWAILNKLYYRWTPNTIWARAPVIGTHLGPYFVIAAVGLTAAYGASELARARERAAR